MEQKLIDEESFERLWERAEAEEYVSQMTAEYPHWRARRRRNAGLAAMAVVVAGAALPMLSTGTKLMTPSKTPTVTICNQPDISNQYWVDMADALLMEA